MLVCPECRKIYPSDASECDEHKRALVPLSVLQEEDKPLAQGTMVGEYRIDRKLGSGTFGDVYAGEQPLIGKRVAIKVLNHKFSLNSAVVSRFVAEARAVNRIRHRNIIDIFSFGKIGDSQPYFVMELLDGVTLRELLDREGRLRMAEALPILRGIADGLDAAHEVGITHRDLKPDNIFLATEKDGRYFPKLLDFGIAKLIDDDITHKTATGAPIGTPSYMAPEQCRGKAVDYRADIYALGVVTYEMLTGERVFAADSAMDALLKHVHEPPRAMSAVRPTLPKELDAPVLAMLAKSPGDRPSSAGSAVAALAEQASAIMASDGPASEVVASSDAPENARPSWETSTITVDSEGRAPSASSGATEGSGGAAIAGSGSAEAEPTVRKPRAPVAKSSKPVASSERAGATPPAERSGGANTEVAEASRSSGTLISAPPPSSALRGDVQAATLPSEGTPQARPQARSIEPRAAPPERSSPERSSSASARAGRVPVWPFAIAGGAIVATIVASQRGGKPEATGAIEATSAVRAAPAGPSAQDVPAAVTIRLAVTPSDADVIVDGVRVGAASAPLVLMRSDQSRAVRVEKEGYEAQALWIVPDRDREMPPIALRAVPPIPLATPAASAQPSASVSAKPSPKPAYHDDLERPSEFRQKK